MPPCACKKQATATSAIRSTVGHVLTLTLSRRERGFVINPLGFPGLRPGSCGGSKDA